MKRLHTSLLLAAVLAGWGMPPAVQTQSGPFYLQSGFGEDALCLEGNQARSEVHHGAAFMSPCDAASGEMWVIEPAEEEGWYRLHTVFRGPDECLDGSDPTSVIHDGGAYMDPCLAGAPGQLWRMVERGDGFYTMHTRFGGEERCLESNDGEVNSMHVGAAFMDRCADVPGQAWRMVAVDEAAAAGPGEAAASIFPLAGAMDLVRETPYPSPSGTHFLVFQGDGNLVVYTADEQFVWGLNLVTDDFVRIARVTMQTDGNLAAYDADGGWVWSARDQVLPAGTTLHLMDTGALQLVDPSSNVLWSSQ